MVKKIIFSLSLLVIVQADECHKVQAWNMDKQEWMTVKLCNEGKIEPKGDLSGEWSSDHKTFYYFWQKD